MKKIGGQTCGRAVTLCADVVAATYAPDDDQPRDLTCELAHPHSGDHEAEGWVWLEGRIAKKLSPKEK